LSNWRLFAMRTELSLPDGYSVREVEGRLYLFDPQGIPLAGPKDPSLIEAYAWRQVWRGIERELNGELADLRAGVRPVPRLRCLRQYTRMLDAVAQIPREAERRPVRRVVAWGAFAASAAAIAAALLMSPLRTTWVDRAPHPVASRSPAMLFSRYLPPAVGAK